VYIRGADNVVADCLSREVLNVDDPVPISSVLLDVVDLPAIARAQVLDDEAVAAMTTNASFRKYGDVWCEISGSVPRPYIPQSMRRDIFVSLHALSHPGVKSTQRLVLQRNYWPNAKADLATWCRECEDCQRSKVGRHTRSALGEMPPITGRFMDVHIDLVGPLESVSGFTYMLTAIDRFTCWPVAVPIPDIRAETVAAAFVQSWVSIFGVPLHVITDRGSQFESEFFYHLSRVLGFHRLRTTSYHPQCNGKVERLHRRLKAAIKCRKQDWVSALPIVLWSLRSLPMEGHPFSPFTLVTGAWPNLPSQFCGFLPPGGSDEVTTMERVEVFLRTVASPSDSGTPTARVKIYVPKRLHDSTHVWLRTDRVRRPLEAPYTGPFKVVSVGPKIFVLDVGGRQQSVSIDRLKPAVLRGPAPLVPVAPPVDAAPAPVVPPVVGPSAPMSLRRPAQRPPAVTSRVGRRVSFRRDNDYHYY
jgi:hypothetical protein